jgi:hypothetical protein
MPFFKIGKELYERINQDSPAPVGAVDQGGGGA